MAKIKGLADLPQLAESVLQHVPLSASNDGQCNEV